MLAKDFRHKGGYYEFVSLLLDRQRQAGDLEYFRIGRAVGDASLLGLLWTIPSDHFRLAACLMRKRFQCLLFNTSFNVTAFLRDTLLIISAKAFGDRIVIQVHGWQDSLADAIGETLWLRALFAMSFRRADLVIVLAERFRSRLIELGVAAESIRVGSSMFDGTLLASRRRADPGAHRRLLFLSRLTTEKGAHQVLAAFRTILERHPGTVLIMAGDGPEKKALQADAKTWGLSSSVRFPGYVRGKKKAELLLTSDIFLLPTTYGEGMPISMLEAMAAGMPVILTRAGAIGELLVDGKHGVLLPSNEPTQISIAVERLLNSPEELRAIGERNRSFVWSRFEAGVVAREIVKLCRDVNLGTT